MITPNSIFHIIFRLFDPLDLALTLYLSIFFGFVSFIMHFYGLTVVQVFMIKREWLINGKLIKMSYLVLLAAIA